MDKVDRSNTLKHSLANVVGTTKSLLVVALTMLLMGAHQANAQNDFCSTRNNSYKAGERLSFRVYYNMSFIWIYAGDATFATRPTELNGRKVLHITGDGRTAKSYEWFYKVRDLYETYIDQESLLPHRFIRNVNEGNISFKHDVSFDRGQNIATSAGKTYSVPQCTQDVLSAIYYARSIDYNQYKPGDRIPFEMFLDDKVYSLYIKYLGKEEIETKKGKFRAIKISPLLIEGTIFSGGEKMTVWVSDDKNHIPLRVDSPITVGSIKVDLVGYENLLHPFESLIRWYKEG